ncbi:MAG: hypothetical protein WCD35_03745 [Mycobacteriales bacterium]
MSTRTTRPSRQDLRAQERACLVCRSRLSAYNTNPTCWAHTVELPWQGPNTRPR